MKRALVGVALVLCSPCLLGQAGKPVDVAAWRADIRTLARELPHRHPGPFVRISQAQWDSAVTAFERRLPALNRNQVLVGVLRLVALVGDAHTAVEPDPTLGLRYYPVELYSFDDGLFVRRADSSAVQVFQLNTRVYPRSANTFDSLGEALLAAGRRDDAIAAYRHAIEVEPGFPPSVQALQRLGVR